MTLLDVQNAKLELEQEIAQKRALLKALTGVEAAFYPDTGSHPGHNEKFPGLKQFVRDNITSVKPEFSAHDLVERAKVLGFKYPLLRIQWTLAQLKQTGVVETVKQGAKGIGLSTFRISPTKLSATAPNSPDES